MRLSDAQERNLVLGAWCRRLALLLDLGVPLVAAAEITSQGIAALAEVMLPLCARVRQGEPLSDAMGHQPEQFPAFVRAAVLAGEHAGEVARALRGLAECLEHERLLDLRPRLLPLVETPAEAPNIRLTRELLLRAVREEATELHLGAESDALSLRLRRAGHWEPVERLDLEDPQALLRRLLVLAEIPYWTREPAVGTAHLRLDDRDYDIALRAIPGAEGGWESLELTFHALTPGEDDPA